MLLFRVSYFRYSRAIYHLLSTYFLGESMSRSRDPENISHHSQISFLLSLIPFFLPFTQFYTSHPTKCPTRFTSDPSTMICNPLLLSKTCRYSVDWLSLTLVKIPHCFDYTPHHSSLTLSLFGLILHYTRSEDLGLDLELEPQDTTHYLRRLG